MGGRTLDQFRSLHLAKAKKQKEKLEQQKLDDAEKDDHTKE